MPICDFQKKLLLKLPRRIAALVLSVLLFLAGSGFLYAQSAPGSPLDLAGEIQSIENAIRAQNLPLQERRDNLMRLARLRQLSGDLEGAATNWLEAAIVSPGVIDPVPLLYCAFALAAMGEWERARAAIAPLLAPGFNAPELALRARFLDGFIAAVTGDTAPLAAMAANSGNGAILSEIYYVLWRTSEPAAAEAWRQRLVSRFPQSPEGRVAASSAEA
ncbi:MAG: hypothetical protein FWG66_09095, partial [Spirochaetes bacterium]|nr:hypothetical protein [Spirochaetota bacterium]